ncbi:MAG: hypothetical protein RL398_675 [Planctomycetota bacterium]
MTTLLPNAADPAPKATKRSAKRSAPRLADVDAEVLEFIAALDRFKEENRRPFPSWSEVLTVVKALGYTRKPS